MCCCYTTAEMRAALEQSRTIHYNRKTSCYLLLLHNSWDVHCIRTIHYNHTTSCICWDVHCIRTIHYNHTTSCICWDVHCIRTIHYNHTTSCICWDVHCIRTIHYNHTTSCICCCYTTAGVRAALEQSTTITEPAADACCLLHIPTSHGQIFLHNGMCCQTETEVAHQTVYRPAYPKILLFVL